MAQTTSKSKRPLIILDHPANSDIQKSTAINDNVHIATSGLRFREQKQLRKRADDLSWQIKFAQMKLKHWRNADATGWDPLDKMLNMARANVTKMSVV